MGTIPPSHPLVHPHNKNIPYLSSPVSPTYGTCGVLAWGRIQLGEVTLKGGKLHCGRGKVNVMVAMGGCSNTNPVQSSPLV